MARKTLDREFPSLSAMIDRAEMVSGKPDPSSRTTSDGKWSGTRSFPEAVSMAFGGWVEGAKRIEKRRAAILGLVDGGSLTVEYARRGPGVLNMTRFNNGHPRPYAVLVPAPGVPKVVRVLVNVAASSSVKTEVIERRGAAVCALVDAMTRAGKQVEVRIVSGHKSDGIQCNYFATIKPASARLNLPTVAFALAHPAMLRRIVFGVLEHEDGKAWEALRYGYGMPSNVEPPQDVVYLPTMINTPPEWSTDTAAADWVRKVSAEHGVTLD